MDGFVSSNIRILKLIKALDSVAVSPASVLIKGERGSGKKHIARIIYEKRTASLEKNASLLLIKCADCSAAMLQDMLCKKSGGMTVILDGIHMLDVESQGILYDSICEEPRGKNTKWLALTSEDMDELVLAGDFDRKLQLLLGGIFVTCPPLREIASDIIPLAQYFLDFFCRDMSRKVNGFSPAALDLMQSYWWPGNIRELKIAVERAVLCCRGSRIEASDVLPFVSGAYTPEIEGLELKEAVNDFKKGYIEKVLVDTRGNKADAARRLGIQRTYLFKLINDLKIEL